MKLLFILKLFWVCEHAVTWFRNIASIVDTTCARLNLSSKRVINQQVKMNNNIRTRQIYERFRQNNNIVNDIIGSIDIASRRNINK